MDQKFKPRTCGDCGWYRPNGGSDPKYSVGACRRVTWDLGDGRSCMATSVDTACPAYVRVDPDGCYMPANQGITEDQLRAEIKRIAGSATGKRRQITEAEREARLKAINICNLAKPIAANADEGPLLRIADFDGDPNAER